MNIIPVCRPLWPPGNMFCLALALLIPCSITMTAGAETSTGTDDWLPVSAIEEGMIGYGLTVFQGSRIDTFAVQVVGIQRGARAGGDLILVEVSGHDLERSAVAQGMSGSPVFIDGKFIGAVAFGWAGALRPLAGVTPAVEMLTLPVDPEPANGSSRTGGALVETGGLHNPLNLLHSGDDIHRSLSAALWPDHIRQLGNTEGGVLPTSWPTPEELLRPLLAGVERPVAAEGTNVEPLPVGWFCQPLGNRSETVAASGGGSQPRSLQPGSACAIPLISGDALLGAIGTVSWVDDDRVFMMGHPFLQRGPVEFPLATADILTVFPSRQMSFKIGSIGRIIGSVYHDQRAGLTGLLGPSPDLVPVTVDVVHASGLEQQFSFDVVHDGPLTPSLVFWCLYNSLLVKGDDQSQQTVAYGIRTEWTAQGSAIAPVDITGLVVGPNGAAALGPEWMVPFQILLNNPHADLKLEAVRATLNLSRSLSAARLTRVAVPGSGHAGQTLSTTVTLSPYRGPEQQVELALELPDYLEPGRYRLVVANARDLFGLEVERAAARFSDRSLDATLDLLRTPRSADELVVALLAPSRGVVINGRELARLPGSVAGLLRAERSGNVTPTLAGYVCRKSLQTDLLLQGYLIKEFEVLQPAKPAREESRP